MPLARRCKLFSPLQEDDIENCGCCQRWTGERCGNETVAVNMNDPELVESLGFCQW